MSALRSRRAPAAASAIEKQPLSIDKHDDIAKQRSLALSSIKSCYRMAFYSTAVDIFCEFSQPTQNMTSLSFLLKVIQSLHILGFGVGLYQNTAVFETSALTLSPDSLIYILERLSRMWFTTFVCLLLGAMALSTNLSDYLDNESLYYVAPLAVLMTACIVAFLIITFSPKYVPNHTTTKQMGTAQRMGFITLQNMALCIAMLVIDAVTLLLDDVLQPGTSIYIKIYSLTDAAEPVAIAVLLYTLRLQMRRIVVDEMKSDGNLNLGNQVDLFQAQHGFFTKVGGVFKGAATAKLVSPWLALFKSSILSYKDWCATDNPNKLIGWLAECE